LEFKIVDWFDGGRTNREHEEKPSKQRRKPTTNSDNLHVPRSGIKPRPQ
jgi:hypothetical protein